MKKTYLYFSKRKKERKKQRRNTTIKLIYRDIIKNDIETTFLNI